MRGVYFGNISSGSGSNNTGGISPRNYLRATATEVRLGSSSIADSHTGREANHVSRHIPFPV